jgi:L-lysine 2,3-aminomutase
VRAACARLRNAGVTLLNQSVLLRGVNDDADTLAQLSRMLMDAGVVPYYLHLPDRVRGTAHFDVDESAHSK